MSARAKASSVIRSSSQHDIQKLCIFAGGGELPKLLIDYCTAHNIEPFVVGFKGQTDDALYNYGAHLETRIGASGKTLRWLKKNNIHHVVFIGAIKRPKLRSMIPDLTTFWFFISKGIWVKGDNGILALARKELEKRDIKLWGIHNFLPELLTPKGHITNTRADKYQDDIALGIQESQKLGKADMGQAVLVKDGKIIGRENQKGTNALIYNYGQEGAVLVKTCKPQQDKDLDLPTIGLGTVKACASKGVAGIAAHAGNSLMINREELAQRADAQNIFVIGVDVK